MKDLNILFEEGQGILIDTVKGILFEMDPSLFDRYDFTDDSLFSEPLLFSLSAFKDNSLTIDQILYGALKKKKAKIQVMSDENGVVSLPKFGLLKTKTKNKLLTLVTEDESLSLSDMKIQVNFELTEGECIELENRIELTNYIDPLSKQVFANWERLTEEELSYLQVNNYKQVDLLKYKGEIEKAFIILKEFYPSEYRKYLKSTRKIVLFKADKMRNFVARQAHGTVFFNVDQTSNTSFFIEEIVHECSHNFFNSVTYNQQDYFKVEPYSPLANYIDKKFESRNLYGAFHGIYTTGRIVEVFLKILKSPNRFDTDFKYEMIGRLAVNTNRHNSGFEQILFNEVMTEKGIEIFNKFYEELDNNIKNNPSYFEFDMVNHPVVFNYEQFLLDNPIENCHSQTNIKI